MSADYTVLTITRGEHIATQLALMDRWVAIEKTLEAGKNLAPETRAWLENNLADTQTAMMKLADGAPKVAV